MCVGEGEDRNDGLGGGGEQQVFKRLNLSVSLWVSVLALLLKHIGFILSHLTLYSFLYMLPMNADSVFIDITGEYGISTFSAINTGINKWYVCVIFLEHVLVRNKETTSI